MSTKLKVHITVAFTVVGGLFFLAREIVTGDRFYDPVYDSNCAVCHGSNLEGTPQGSPLVGVDLMHGTSVDEISKSIAEGYPARNMPAFSQTLNEAQIQSLAIFISEKRLGFSMTDFNVSVPLDIPEGIIESEQHTFQIETVATDLHPLPYSIAPLPDGRILLTEKMRGLSIIAKDGEQSKLIQGTPEAYDDGFEVPGIRLKYGLGWMMDVALHPNYEDNGWIYLHYGDRCSDCNVMSRGLGVDVSMNMLVRGRIENGEWVDEETIWRADVETYTQTPDMAAGGRICFDDEGHVFISVGMKGPINYWGIQDLSLPYGKIHRMHDDGRVPADNPFVDVPGALKTTWTYGHRSPQGLEFNPLTRQLWGTEMGPRGGDEVNLLLPGKNYGWPLYSKGLDYDGTAVEYGEVLGIEFELTDIEQPVVDLTPSPAVSSFIFYEGSAFPEWRHNMIVGTLKATEIYRMVLEGDEVVHTEILLQDLARIRDIETGLDGAIYLLLEHASGGQIVRLVPGHSNR